MILLTVDEIISLHERLINETGGSHGLRERGLLESAVYGAYAEYDDTEVYPSIEEKAARLAYAIVGNHPFIDGNKRIGIFTMLMTIRLNNLKLIYTQQELINLGLGLAAGSMSYKDALEWITHHSPDKKEQDLDEVR